MKFKLSNIAVIALSAIGFSSMAKSSDDAALIKQINPGKEMLSLERAYKSRTDSLYYVQFNDSALAAYTGGVEGFAATNIKVNNANVTNKGMLNVHSTNSKQYKFYLQQQQGSFIDKASRILNRRVNAKHDYQIVLNAIALELSPVEAKLLAKQPEVKQVEKVGMHYLHTASGPEFIGSKSVWTGTDETPGTKGEGVIVGIIDTGINAYHPSFADIGGDNYDHDNPLGSGNYLGDCQEFPQFCNDKLIGMVSFDLIIDNYPEVMNDQYDELDDKLQVAYDFQGHGSHVAATAAGNILHDVNFYLSVQDDTGVITDKSDFKFDTVSGVAPHANIVAYQVCDFNGCWPELTYEAVEHAIENNVDVLNYSVGGSARDPWSSSDAIAFLNAREAGLHVATSAGNSGSGASTIGAPGNAPWITTVAAYTHDRGFTPKTLTSFTGGDNPPSVDITGMAATGSYSGAVVLAKDFGDAQCLTPFAENTFAGEIVVCERGSIARVRKGLNVKEGGAGGLILMNLTGEAESINADNHLLPAIHINASDGDILADWLATGSEHKLTITGSEITKDPELGDIAGVFTSRGPNAPYTNIFSPDIAGPGVGIYAAYAEDTPFHEEHAGVPFSTLDGTSMSSPHVAGALALIHATHPMWTPAQVQSAVMSTAHRETYKDDDFDGIKERSTFFDQGAGSIRVHKAINAGLLLDISFDEYVNADPANGGDPAALNSTSMVSNKCITSCTWTRMVTAVKDSSWTANYEYLNPGFELQISPSSFTLKAGESQQLTISASANIELQDDWVHGYIILDNADETMSDTHLQTTVAFSAGVVIDEVSAQLNNVTNHLVIEDIITSGSNDLQTKGFGLFKAHQFTGTAQGASNPNEVDMPWFNPDVIFVKTINVRPYTKRIVAEITGSTSPDMDLYVGIDEDLDGLPNATEMYYSLMCISGNIDSKERCIIDNPPSGTYWVYAHNFEGSVEGEPDTVDLEVTQISYSSIASFDITAPQSVEADEEFDVTLSVNGYLDYTEALMPLEQGDVYYGLLEMGSTAELKRNIGKTLVKVSGIENVVVNTAPIVNKPIADVQIELSTDNTAIINVDIDGVFSDAETFDLIYSFAGVEGIELTESILNASFTAVGSYDITVSASDGELSTETSFTVTVTAAPAVIIPTPVPTDDDTSGGGSTSGLMLMLLGCCVIVRRKLLT